MAQKAGISKTKTGRWKTYAEREADLAAWMELPKGHKDQRLLDAWKSQDAPGASNSNSSHAGYLAPQQQSAFPEYQMQPQRPALPVYAPFDPIFSRQSQYPTMLPPARQVLRFFPNSRDFSEITRWIRPWGTGALPQARAQQWDIMSTGLPLDSDILRG